MAPTVLGVELGATLGPLDGPPEPPGEPVGGPLATEPEHAARTTTSAARAAERDIIDMAAGRPTSTDGSTDRVRLRNGSKGLDGTRIFSAMSSGLRARADRARTLLQARLRRPVAHSVSGSRASTASRSGGGGSGEGVPRP